MNNTAESELDDYSVAELCKLYAAFKACDWDLTLEHWTDRQISEALESNIVPQWGANEQDPIYLEEPKLFAE